MRCGLPLAKELMNSIRVERLYKRFGQVEALKDISFSVNFGELFGIIGPDGAGKTTLMRIITTLLLPDSGRVTVSDYDVVEQYVDVRKLLGYMPETFSLYHDLTVEENLQFFADVFDTSIAENYRLIRDIYRMLEPFKDRQAGKLSGGMKQKLALSCALIHKPEVLVLDEPTTGVDALSRMEFWELLAGLKTEGITILVSTAYMDEASQCDRVALIRKGQLLGVDSPDGFAKHYPHRLFTIDGSNPTLLLEIMRRMEDCRAAYLSGNYIRYVSSLPDLDPADLQKRIHMETGAKVAVDAVSPTIEDFFIDRIGTVSADN